MVYCSGSIGGAIIGVGNGVGGQLGTMLLQFMHA